MLRVLYILTSFRPEETEPEKHEKDRRTGVQLWY